MCGVAALSTCAGNLGFESVHFSGPGLGIKEVVQPPRERNKRLAVQGVEPFTTEFTLPHQPHLTQYAQVSADCRTTDREPRRQLTCGKFSAASEKFQDPGADGVTNCSLDVHTESVTVLLRIAKALAPDLTRAAFR